MASRCRTLSKPALNFLKSSINKPTLKPISPQLPRSIPTFSRLPSELGCVQSLLPLHSAIASARLTACLGATNSRSLSQGRQIHAQIVRHGYTSDVFLGTALIDIYSKCGNVDAARQFFDGMHEKNVVSWNEMIHGYAQNGYGDEAVEIFEEMIRVGEKPDEIAFIAVFTACSHSGLVDAGTRIFHGMEPEHMVQPSEEHYTCILDLLGRAGQFKQAEVLINNMPFKDDPII